METPPQPQPKWFRVINGAANRTEVLIYDRIGRSFWDESGVTFKEFREEWNAIPASHEIDLRINSPGGSIWDGLPIYNLVAERRDRVTAHVEGVAASIASVIAMAGKRVVMPVQAELFIHEPWTTAEGDASVMRNAADRLEFLGDQVAEIYARKAGQSATAMRKLMKAGGIGTSFFGAQALAAGLVDEITDAAPMQNQFDLSRLRRVPAGVIAGGTTPQPQNTIMSDTKTALAAEPIPAPTTPAPENRKPEASPQPKPEADPQNVVSREEFNRVTAQLEGERRRRVTSDLNKLASERDLDPQDWIDRVMLDEALLATLGKLPTRGTGPVTAGIANLGNPVMEKWKGMQPGGERMLFAVAHHAQLMREMGGIGTPQGANTIATSLVPAFLADGVINILTARLAMLNAFSTLFSPDPMRPKATVIVPKVTVGSTTQTNPTNFESGDSTVVGQSVTVNQISNSFHLTNEQVNQGHQLMILSTAAANNLANAISDVVTALMVAGTTGDNGFGAGTVVGVAGSFDSADLKPIYALAKNYAAKNLLLDGSYIAGLIPTTQDNFRLGQAGAYGFDGIFENNLWTGAITNTVGFVCDRTAIVAASGVPINQPGSEFISVTQTTLKNGLTVETHVWYARATRTLWASHDIMFGAQVGDGTAGEVLISA